MKQDDTEIHQPRKLSVNQVQPDEEHKNLTMKSPSTKISTCSRFSSPIQGDSAGQKRLSALAHKYKAVARRVKVDLLNSSATARSPEPSASLKSTINRHKYNANTQNLQNSP